MISEKADGSLRNTEVIGTATDVWEPSFTKKKPTASPGLAGDLDTLPAAGQSSARGQFRIHGTGRYVRHADDRRQPLLHVADDHADVRQLRTNLRRGRGTEHDLVARRVELRLRADERALHAQAVRRETELHGTARVQLLLGHTLDLTVNTFNLRGRIFRTEPSGGQLA